MITRILLMVAIAFVNLYSFDITTLDSLMQWIRADTLITRDANNKITAIGDCSGNGYGYEQLDTSKSFTWDSVGLPTDNPTINMLGASKYMDCTDQTWFKSFSGVSIYVRFYYFKQATEAPILSVKNASNTRLDYGFINSAYFQVGHRRVSTDALEYNRTNIYEMIESHRYIIGFKLNYTNTNSDLIVLPIGGDTTGHNKNIGTIGILSDTASTVIRLGAGWWDASYDFDGYLDELIIFGRYLSDSESDSVLEYLKGFNITAPAYGSDNFNRDDRTPIDSLWSKQNGSSYTNNLSNHNFRFYGSTGGDAYTLYDTTTVLSDTQYSKVEYISPRVLGTPASFGVIVRGQKDTLSGYLLIAEASAPQYLRLKRYDEGALTTLQSVGINYNYGSTINAIAIGDTIYCYLRDTLKMSVYDTMYQSGFVGIWNSGAYLDNWFGGDLYPYVSPYNVVCDTLTY